MDSRDWKISYARPCVSPELLEAGYTPLLSAVLSQRGVSSAQDAEKLLNCGEDCLWDPMLMLGMAEAKSRVELAVQRRETVAVYGDYDVDGITSTCLLTHYLRSRGLQVLPYIPDRNEEGYGLNRGALDSLRAQDVTLLITVDCGITAVDEAEYAATLGMELIITDHHECGSGALPRAAALIDCKQPGDNYPNKDLAGVGVALKLACACEGGSKDILDRYSDLAAIGTVADVMPLVGENRYLVRRGLEQIERDPRPGIAAMLRESSMDPKKLNAASIGFSLAPRLNAAGRLGNAKVAGELLMCEDEDAAARLASELCELNRKRQSIETEIWHEATEVIAGAVPDAPIVLASESWHQGVIGIAASRLAEQYSLPAIMICLTGETGKGSCRSYGGFNLYDALSACGEHLIGFGGHALAAGLTIRRDKLEDFRLALTDYYRMNRPSPTPEVQCDLLIRDPALLSVENVRSLDLLEPYGNKNPKPVMCFSGVLLDQLSTVGNGRHVKMRLRMGRSRFECIFFSHAAEELGVSAGDIVDLAFSPQINEYRGNISVQLVASAIREHDCGELCREILSGEGEGLWAAAPYCPDRMDFVRVWRSLGKDFHSGSDAEEIISQCPVGMEPEKFCLCLMVLLESGLLESLDGRIFSACRVNISGKADLAATRLIRELKSLRQG